MAVQIMLPNILVTFNSQSIANVAWAFARLGILNVELMDSLLRLSVCHDDTAEWQEEKKKSFPPRDCVNKAPSLSG